MLQIKQISSLSDLNYISIEEIVDFLYTHLDRFRDTKESIKKCINYIFSTDLGKGGFILTAFHNGKLAGVLVINYTGMEGFIPENILVYIAVDEKHRGKGFGKELITEAISRTNGDLKLHVEYDNPAKRLYERLGFTSKYAEMRYHKTE